MVKRTGTVDLADQSYLSRLIDDRRTAAEQQMSKMLNCNYSRLVTMMAVVIAPVCASAQAASTLESASNVLTMVKLFRSALFGESGPISTCELTARSYRSGETPVDTTSAMRQLFRSELCPSTTAIDSAGRTIQIKTRIQDFRFYLDSVVVSSATAVGSGTRYEQYIFRYGNGTVLFHQYRVYALSQNR